MVRLGLIILLLVCVTITGVYAAWTYAGTDDIADAYAEAKITITDAKLSGANGEYEITSNLVVTIDQANTKHEAKLVFAANDGQEIYLKVVFKPADNAPQKIKDEAVPTELYFTTTTSMEYKIDVDGNYSAEGTPTKILKFSNPSDGNFSPNISWTKQDDGTFVYELKGEALTDMITLYQTFVLDTKAEHDAFREALNGNIQVRVTDGIVTE